MRALSRQIGTIIVWPLAVCFAVYLLLTPVVGMLLVAYIIQSFLDKHGWNAEEQFIPVVGGVAFQCFCSGMFWILVISNLGAR